MFLTVMKTNKLCTAQSFYCSCICSDVELTTCQLMFSKLKNVKKKKTLDEN